MNQLTKLFSSLTLRQRISLAVAALAVAAGLWTLESWNRERNFRPLYTAMPAEDAGAILQKLKEEGVEYRVDDSGGTVRVPAEKIAELRLRMATAGLPKTGRIGFELFDKSNFGLTEFAEQVNYRRAIEGELERSIASLSEVERARVHISLPKDSVFLESRQEAKASVVVSLRTGKKLTPQSGAAITYLTASAVDRLAPEAVTVIDTRGNLLIRPRKNSLEAGGDQPEADLEYRQKMERDLVLKINATLDPLLGADKFRAGASVDVDLTSGEQSEETYDPARSAPLTVQKTEDITGIPLNTGVPGTASNLPRPPSRPAGSATGTTRKTENTSYQTSKTIRRIRTPQGALKHMSLAVLVDHSLRWEGKGPKSRRIVEPPSAEKLKTIRDLVAAATGLSTTRGDQLTVESLPFESTLNSDPPEGELPSGQTPAPTLPPWLQKYVGKMPAPLLIGIGVASLLMILAPLAFLMLRKSKKAVATGQTALPGGAGNPARVESAADTFEQQLASRAASQERLDAEALQSLKLPAAETKKSEILTKHLKKAAKDDPVTTAQLLRTWIHENEN